MHTFISLLRDMFAMFGSLVVGTFVVASSFLIQDKFCWRLANAPHHQLLPIGDTGRMDSTTNVATTNCGGVFGISHGMHTPGRLSTDKTTTIKNWSSKILPKLKYRGDLREFEEWEKMVKSAAHALDIPMEPVPPTKAALKLHEHYAKLDDTAPELEKAYIDAWFPHADTKSESMIGAHSRLRSKVRITHGEIMEIVTDPLTAMRSKTMADYAADESVTGHGRGFHLNIGAQGVHEKVALAENKIGNLVQRSNCALRTAGRHERYQHLAFYAAEDIANNHWYAAGKEKTPMQIFFEGASVPCSAPHCPLVVWGAPCTFTTHPENRDSKYDDRSTPGWYCGASRRNGPADYSMAGIVTQHGNVIAWDWGMMKVIIQPVMDRLEPGGLAIFDSVMPDASILVSDSPAPASDSLPMHLAAVAPQAPPITVPLNDWMAPAPAREWWRDRSNASR